MIGFGQIEYNIGDTAFGGVIFYLTPNGKSGLVVSVNDQGFGDWKDATDNVNIPKNHNNISKEFIDWRLPTKHELGLIYTLLHLNGIGNFKNESRYWTSTEGRTSRGLVGGAERLNFKNGKWTWNGKIGPCYFRGVRSF